MHDDGFYEMLDKALEEACSDPLKLGKDGKTWQVVDETVEANPRGSQDSILGPSEKEYFKQHYVEMDKYTAPQNRKQFAVNKIPIPKNDQSDFDIGINLNP